MARKDVVPYVASWFGKTIDTSDSANPEHDVNANRLYVVVLGIAVVAISIVVNDVVFALTIAYDILVGGLLVAIIGGLVWKRGTGLGAAWSIAVGCLVTVALLVLYATGTIDSADGIYANEPIYFGLASSLLVYVVVSLLSPATPANIRKIWDDRLAAAATDSNPDGEPAVLQK